MSSGITVPVIIAISSGAGVIVIVSTAIAVFLIVHRRGQSRLDATKHDVDTTVQHVEAIDTRSSYEIEDSPVSQHSRRPLFKAFSERNLKSFGKNLFDEPTRTRNLLQRKRYGGVRASSLPVFSIVAPRIPSPTLPLGKQSVLFEEGESYMLSPIADSDVATVGGSCMSLTDQWPLPPGGAGSLQTLRSESLRPPPLFQGYSRTHSGHFIPSAHPPRANLDPKSSGLTPASTRSDEPPGLKRFMSAQQIGQAPKAALPIPPQRRLSSLRGSDSHMARSRSPRSRSTESLISGTSSILRSISSPVSSRKRSATDANWTTPSLGYRDDSFGFSPNQARSNGPPGTSLRVGSSLAHRPLGRSPQVSLPQLRTYLSNEGNGDDTASLPRNKSSALSVALMNARMPHQSGPSLSRASSNASRPSMQGSKRLESPTPYDAPAVQSPSPKRFVRGYRLLQTASVVDAPVNQPSSNWPLRVSIAQDQEPAKEWGYHSGIRPTKSFVSHLPRSPRPEDRPAGVHLTPRSQTSSGRGSPIDRVLPPGVEAGNLTSAHSNLLLRPTPSPPGRNRNSAIESVTSSPPMESVTCGDLASYLRRTDSQCEADDGAGYFNLTGGTCTSPGENSGPSSQPKRPLEIDVNSDAPLYGRSTRTSGFYTPGSIPVVASHTPSSPLSIDHEPGLTPNTSSSPNTEQTDHAWLHGGSSSERSVGGLGLGLAGRFDITAGGMSFSPATSPAPSPCPSPPPRSTLRNTLLAGFGNALAQGIECGAPGGLKKLDGGDRGVREFGVLGNNNDDSPEAAPVLAPVSPVRRPEHGWRAADTRAAQAAGKQSAEQARDMQRAAQRSGLAVRAAGYPVERRDRRSLLPLPSPQSPVAPQAMSRAASPPPDLPELPGMAF